MADKSATSPAADAAIARVLRAEARAATWRTERTERHIRATVAAFERELAGRRAQIVTRFMQGQGRALRALPAPPYPSPATPSTQESQMKNARNPDVGWYVALMLLALAAALLPGYAEARAAGASATAPVAILMPNRLG